MAGAPGSQIGEPLLIEEDQDVKVPRFVNKRQTYFGSGDEDVLKPGTIPIRARVKAAFRLITIEN